MTSYVPTLQAIDRKWYVVDAEGKTLGRLASEVAKILRGKKKPVYTPFLDTGDYVIIVNASKFKVTGKKMTDKTYFSHSRYIGGWRNVTMQEMLKKCPEKVMEHAIKGMLPKGALGNQMYRKLFVYCTSDHPHQAQKPEPLEF